MTEEDVSLSRLRGGRQLYIKCDEQGRLRLADFATGEYINDVTRVSVHYEAGQPATASATIEITGLAYIFPDENQYVDGQLVNALRLDAPEEPRV